MNDELNDLYQQVILDHNKNPRNFGKLEPHTHSADGHNPLCGDQIEVQLYIEGDVIKDVMFNGNGCAISKASASVSKGMDANTGPKISFRANGISLVISAKTPGEI